MSFVKFLYTIIKLYIKEIDEMLFVKFSI